jgi:hypothetical protein
LKESHDLRHEHKSYAKSDRIIDDKYKIKYFVEQISKIELR